MANLWIVQDSAAIPPQPLPLFVAPLASWATPRQGGHRNGINTHSRPGRARRAVASPNPVNNTTIHRFRVTPGDVSVVGVVDGGPILERIHGAAYATAARRSGRRCVAASIGDFHLDRPICVGELVDVRADLVYTGRSSMHVLCHRQRRRPYDGVGSNFPDAPSFSSPLTKAATREPSHGGGPAAAKISGSIGSPNASSSYDVPRTLFLVHRIGGHHTVIGLPPAGCPSSNTSERHRYRGLSQLSHGYLQ